MAPNPHKNILSFDWGRCYCVGESKFSQNVSQLFLTKVTTEERGGVSFGPKKNRGLNYLCHQLGST